MAYPETYQEPYTKYPNRYSDLIKPRLTGTQRDICDIVIRMTYGWHQTSAAISNTVFAKKASKSKQGIIKARKQLEEIGILVVLQEGGGSKTNEYMLDLWYDNPDKSVKASIIRQEEQLLEMENPPSQEEQEDIPEILEAPAIDGPTIFEEPEVEMETPSIKTESSTEQEENTPYEENVLESQPKTEENLNCGIPESQLVESENHTPEDPNSEQEISDTELAANPSSIEDSEPPTSKLSLPPYKEDLSNNISREKKKQTEDPQEKKKAAATVRYRFLSLFPENKADDDWQFFGWVAKEYGLEACLAKLDYMKEHHRQHSIINPKGFFRTALVKDFQPPAFIVAKLKADEVAKHEKERCRRKSEEWRQMTTDFNYGSAAASLQKLLDSLN